jgi:hypothetical protein
MSRSKARLEAMEFLAGEILGRAERVLDMLNTEQLEMFPETRRPQVYVNKLAGDRRSWKPEPKSRPRLGSQPPVTRAMVEALAERFRRPSPR